MDRTSRSERGSRDEPSRRDEPRGGGDRDRGGRDRGGERGGERGGRGGGRYEGYHRRDSESVKKRASQTGGDFDRYLKDGLKAFKTNEGDNTIRFLPPTWPKADHYGYDIFVHYGVGADSQTYLCPKKMKDQDCPICEEHAKAVREGEDEKYIKSLEPKKRVLVYIVDRDAEKDGVLVWSMPWTLDRDICKVSQVDKSSGETLFIDDPENGYDVDFERKGNKDRTEYIGVAIARRESSLGNSKWLDFATDNPLPDQLVVYDYEHIAKALGGGGGGDRDRGGRGGRDDAPSRSSRDEPARRETSRGRASLDAEQDAALKRGTERPAAGPTWGSIHKMTFDQMCELVDAEHLRIDPDKSKDDTDLADWICEEMKIKDVPDEPSPRARGGERGGRDEEPNPRDRLRNMREDRDR